MICFSRATTGASSAAAVPAQAGQRRAIDDHALARPDLRLAIERKMIGVAGDEDMRDGRLGRDAAGDQQCGCRRLHHHARTGAAGELRPPRHHDPELRRDDVEPLGTILTDHHHGGLTARAGRRLGRQIHLSPRQMRGQLAATGAAFSRALATQRRIDPLRLRLDLGDRRFRILGPSCSCASGSRSDFAP